MNIQPEQLLAEIEGVLRSMPDRATIRHDLPENHAWLGRAGAALSMWDSGFGIAYVNCWIAQIHSNNAIGGSEALKQILTTLYRAQSELRMQTTGPMTTAIGQGGVFDYFDEVRKVAELAKSDLFFVDPYLDAEFVSRYLPQVASSVHIRLLGRERIQTLIPAAEMLAKQRGLKIEVRSANGFHDRYVFVDKAACYQSGASFKDGAKNAPTTLTQIVDALNAVRATYEDLWAAGKPHA